MTAVSLPVEYIQAKRALAAVTRIVEAKTIRGKAIAMAVFAYQAKDIDLMGKATEVRKRAERRIGELIKINREAGKLAKAGRRSKNRVFEKPDSPKSLASQGVDKNLADRARKAAAMPEAKFEASITKAVKIAVAAITRTEEVIKQARAEMIATKLENRKRRHKEIRAAAKTDTAVIAARRFALLYADPPWLFKTYTELGGQRAPDNKYPTLSDDEIINFTIEGKPIEEIVHKDAALFLWCTSSNIPLALRVMEAWGFTFKSSAVWVKDKEGTGQIFRNWHEVLLYGTRGKKWPGPLYLPPSVFKYPRGVHSAKPPEIRQEIERMYPDLDATTRLELFSRSDAPGWTHFGFEAKQQAAE
jgi:N6-adenosine-specific RNA methylase IME4